MPSVNRSDVRLARLLALVPYLRARPGARLADVADFFGITADQLSQDLDLVWMCGLPGQLPGDLIDMTIDGDTVTLTDPQTIGRPLRLTADEATALVVALRALVDVPGLDDHDAVAGALTKIEEASGSAGRSAVSVALDEEAERAALATVRGALERGHRLHLRYYTPTRDETTDRDVDPMRLLLVEGHSYLEGWCRRVDDVRFFRLDRIVEVAELAVAADPPSRAVLREVGDRLFTPAPDDAAVTLLLGPAARWVADYYPCERVEEIPGGQLRVILRTPDTGWVRRLALRLGGSARVLDPPELAAAVRADAQAALAAYPEAAPAPGEPTRAPTER